MIFRNRKLEIVLFLVLSFLVQTACDSFSRNKTQELRDGRKATYRIDRDSDRVSLLVFVSGIEANTNLKDIQKDAFGIWEQFKEVAERENIEEGLLNYKTIGVDGKERSFLFTAEKIETGAWLVRAAN